MWSVQFSNDGQNFFSVLKLSERELADRVCLALAGYACEPYRLGKYWRVRQADQDSQDFHAVKSPD